MKIKEYKVYEERLIEEFLIKLTFTDREELTIKEIVADAMKDYEKQIDEK
jgi:hypothetical protein